MPHIHFTVARAGEAIQLPMVSLDWLVALLLATTTRTTGGGKHDRSSDLARFGGPGRYCHMGGSVVSAEIIPFTRASRRGSGRPDFPALRSLKRADDLVMDHFDTAPCESASAEAQPEEFRDG
jgi:hypothetical protein